MEIRGYRDGDPCPACGTEGGACTPETAYSKSGSVTVTQAAAPTGGERVRVEITPGVLIHMTVSEARAWLEAQGG